RIDRLPLNQPIGLKPEPDLTGVAKAPAVADDAVLSRQATGQYSGLRRTGDSPHDALHGVQDAFSTPSRQVGRVRAGLPGRQSDHVEQTERLQSQTTRSIR